MGFTALSPGASIARKAVLERECIRPLPSPQISISIGTCNMRRRWAQTVLDQLVGAKAIQSEEARGGGGTVLQIQVLPEVLFRLSRKKEGSEPQAEESQHSGAERKSRRWQRVHRAEPSVKKLPI